MKEFRFESAFPQVPEKVHLRLEQALQEKEREGKNMPMKLLKRPALALGLALIMLLILSGSAYALANRFGILDYLVRGESNATDSLKTAVQPVTATVTEDNIKIDLTGAIFDGQRLALSFTAENLLPDEMARITLDSVTLGGQNIHANFGSFEEQWVPDIFALDIAGTYSRNPVSGGMLSSPISNEFSGSIAGEAVFTVSRPSNGRLVIADPALYYDLNKAIPDPESRADHQERIDAVWQSNQEIMDAFDCLIEDELYSLLEQGRTVVDRSGSLLLESEYQAWQEFFDAPQFVETARIVLPFTLDADAAQAAILRPTIEDVQLSDCLVQLRSAFLSPLSTAIVLRMYPSNNSLEGTLPLTSTFPDMTDENGQPLSFLDMEYEAYNSRRQDENSRWYAEFVWDFPGLADIPDEIHFAFDTTSADETNILFQAEFSQSIILKVLDE